MTKEFNEKMVLNARVMNYSMLDVTKGIIYDLVDEANGIANTDENGFNKYAEVLNKLSTIENYVLLMDKETGGYDEIKQLKKEIHDEINTVNAMLTYYNGYQQAMKDFKK